MKHAPQFMTVIIVGALLGQAAPLSGQECGTAIVAWGNDGSGRLDVPSSSTGFAALAAGYGHSLGLQANGSIAAWGYNFFQQCELPAPNEGFVAIAAGYALSMGLKNDGSIVVWGGEYGVERTVPAPNADFTSVAAGHFHALGLKSDGSIVAWGINEFGQCNVPLPNTGYTAIAGGGQHSLGLKADGSVVAWGDNQYGQCSVPFPNSGFTAVAAGGKHSLGLKANGSIAAWGCNDYGQCDVPEPNAGFTAVSAGRGLAGMDNSLGLRIDGSIVAWGNDDFGQCDVPLPNAEFTAIAAGGLHSLSLAPFPISLSDVPDDEGGKLRVEWNHHPNDAAGRTPAVVSYELQRQEPAWTVCQLVTATQADAYSVTIEASDVLTIGQPAPARNYRLVARTTDPLTSYTYRTTSSYSIDNLPPASPELGIFDTMTHRFVFWNADSVADVGSTCLHRGSEQGFEPCEPVFCSASEDVYEETHLLRYYYRARTFDIHGNASEWSNEVVGRWPTPVPNVVPTTLCLYPCQPNPFNPRTTIKYDLPESGPVRLSVFDVAGRLVRTLVDESMPQGSHEAVWDGRDSSGREVGSGSYLARLEFGGRVETVRMGLVR